MILSGAIPGWAAKADHNTAIDVVAAEEPPMYKGYPMHFDKMGYLDQIQSQSVTIEDASHGFAYDAGFYMPKIAHVSYSSFKPGDYVGILLNDEGKIKSLWLIKRR